MKIEDSQRFYHKITINYESSAIATQKKMVFVCFFFPDDTPETCIYSGWSPWSACSSATCDKGRRMRQRMLKAQLDLSVPCPHTQDFQPCMAPGCSVDGNIAIITIVLIITSFREHSISPRGSIIFTDMEDRRGSGAALVTLSSTLLK